MERKIGEIFEYNGEWYQCVEGNGCADCAFYEKPCNRNPLYETIGSCRYYRKDATSVIFKKLEKVGEPYEFDGHIFQAYRTFAVPIFTENYATVREFGNNSKISIEIKQNKEDMEEKKLNLKPFDIQKAREGKPVCTRDGRKVRIICFDLKGAEYPIVAAVETHDCLAESISAYDKNGKFDHDKENNNDLMMLPEKKEGWMNIYNNGYNHKVGALIYNSKEEALNNKESNAVDTIKIEWEE